MSDKPGELSPADKRALARLVGKYGRAFIANAVKDIRPMKRGRPARGQFPYLERMHLADWIEEAVAEHKAKGSRNPLRDAVVDLFELSFEEEEQREPGRFDRFEKTTLRKFYQGRRELAAIKAALNAKPRKR